MMAAAGPLSDIAKMKLRTKVKLRTERRVTVKDKANPQCFALLRP